MLAALTPGEGATGVEDVCGLPFIEDTVKDLAGYRRRAIAAVDKVRTPRLAAMRAACLAALRKSA